MKYNFDMDIDEKSSVGKIASQIKSNSSVLEFGPGNGRMTNYLIEEKNCDVSIVELDHELYEHVMEIAQDGFYGDIESFGWAEYYNGKKFDYIIFADVLEHLNNPKETLRKTSDFLNESGEILITFPNLVHNSVMIDLFNNKLDWASYGLLDETHKSFYTQQGFHKVFKEAGLNIKVEDYTCLAVGDTELNSTYEELPAAVRYDFKMRPFGEVYQYFFSLTKIEVEEPTVFSPKNSNYVKFAEFCYDFGDQISKQTIPFNAHTGENEEFVLTMPANLKNLLIQFKQEPCFVEFSAYDSGKEVEITFSSSVVKLSDNCYLFDGKSLPEIHLSDIAGKDIRFELHYRFSGELTKTMRDMLTLLDPIAKERNTLRKENTKLSQELLEEKHRFADAVSRYYEVNKDSTGTAKKVTKLFKGKKQARQDNIQFHIDEKVWDAETKILKVLGWGLNEKTGDSLVYELSSDQAPYFSTKAVSRPDVNEAKHIENTKKLGFEMEIFSSVKERNYLLEVKTSNGMLTYVEV